MTILAAHTWPTNGHLIEEVAQLHFPKNPKVLDPTWGRGLWWTEYAPLDITIHDIRLDGVDFRDLPEETGTFDVVAFDPPYVSVGGRKSSGIPEMLDRYGLADAAKSPASLQEVINAGLQEATRVTKPKGVLLVKCQDYISSGKLWPGTYLTTRFAVEECGARLADRFEFITSPRPQPPGRRQVHARRNYSTLLVFK